MHPVTSVQALCFLVSNNAMPEKRAPYQQYFVWPPYFVFTYISVLVKPPMLLASSARCGRVSWLEMDCSRY